MAGDSPWPWNVQRGQRHGAYALTVLTMFAYFGYCLYILVQAIQGVRFPLSTISYHTSEQVKCPDIRICYEGNDVVFSGMEIFAKFHVSATTWPWDDPNQELSTRPMSGPYFLDSTFTVSNVSNILISQNDQPFYGYNPEGLDYLKTICWDLESHGFLGNNSMYLDVLFRFKSYDITNLSSPLAPSFVWTTLYHGAEISTPYDADYKATEFDIPTQTFTQMVLAAVYKQKLWGRNEVWYRTTNLQTFPLAPDDNGTNFLQIGYTFDQEGVIYLAEINTLQYTTLLSQWAGVWVIVPGLLAIAFVAMKREDEEDEPPSLHIRFTKSHRRDLGRKLSRAVAFTKAGSRKKEGERKGSESQSNIHSVKDEEPVAEYSV